MAQRVKFAAFELDAEKHPMAVADLLAPGDAAVRQVVGDGSADDVLSIRRVEEPERLGLDVGGFDDHPVEVEEHRLSRRHRRSRSRRFWAAAASAAARRPR